MLRRSPPTERQPDDQSLDGYAPTDASWHARARGRHPSGRGRLGGIAAASRRPRLGFRRGAGLGPLGSPAPRPPDRRKRPAGRSQQGDRAPAAVQGRRPRQTVWFVLLDASDAGLAHDLGVNYAPKLGNLGIGCPDCVQTVTLDAPTPQQNRSGRPSSTSRAPPTSARPASRSPGRTASRWPSSSPAPSPAPATARSSGSPARRPSTAPRSSPPVTARSTSTTTPTPATASSTSTSRRRPSPASSPSPGSTCCSSRASTPASRSSTSAPTPASP